MRAVAGADWRQNTEEPADQRQQRWTMNYRTGRIATGHTKVGTLLQYKPKQPKKNPRLSHIEMLHVTVCLYCVPASQSVCGVCVGAALCSVDCVLTDGIVSA